jgi:hypothetical protein
MYGHWINFNIAYSIEEHRENTVYNEPKQTNVIPFFHEYWLNLFHDLSLTVWHDEIRSVLPV